MFSDLAPAMAARGHDVRVITRATGAPAVDLEDGVWVHRIAVPELPEGTGVVPDTLGPINAFATAAAAEVTRIRGWTEPDLVFAPLWDVEGIGILRETDLPVAVHVSTPLAIIGPLAGYLRGDDTDVPELRRLLELEAEVMDSADLFQANTSAVVDTVRANYAQHCDDDRWRIVNLGLHDRSIEDGEREAGASGHRRVFFAGRFEARKGIDTLLAAMERILPDHADVELVLAGEDRALLPGEELVGRSWRTRHRSAPWIDRVTMLGVVDDETLHREYAAAEVVVLPSRYESFGLVMVEALMHGKALVSTDTSGVREVVRHGVDGLLVAPGDVAELEAAIRLVLDDAALAEKLGQAARRRFLEWFSVERFAERFEGFCRQTRVKAATPAPSAAEVTKAGSTTVALAGCAAATLIVRATQETVFRVFDAMERRFELQSGERRRVRLGVAAGEAAVLVDVGALVIERVVLVDEVSGAR